MTVTLHIPEATPSVNILHGHHWSRKLRERKKWGWLVKAAVLEARFNRPETPPERVRVRIVRHGARLLDTDNAIAGSKFLIDSLVAEGLARDDSPKHLTLQLEQHVSRERYTTVVVEACST